MKPNDGPELGYGAAGGERTPTVRDAKLEALQKATEQISTQTYEDIEDQGKLVAGNMLLLIGDKALLCGSGFVYAAIQLHHAAISWALANGYVELTDKGRASEDEVTKRRESRAKRDVSVAAQGPPPDPGAGLGQYL